MKALGVAGKEGLAWRDFEVVLESSGRPTMILHGEAAVKSKELKLAQLHVSLTHSRLSAGAVVIAEGGLKDEIAIAKQFKKLNVEEGK